MKTMLLLFFLCPVSFSVASARSPLFIQDSTASQNKYKINENEFLKRYACDDSSRALIQFYFRKRNHQKATFFSGASAAALAGLVYFPVKNMSDNDYHGVDFRILFVAGIAFLLATATPLVLNGGVFWIMYSRTRLLKWLNNYSNGKSIPKGISKNVVFRGFIKYGEWGWEISKMMKATEAYNRKIRHRKILRTD